MRLVVTTLSCALACFVASAADNPLAGSWKLNPAKSVGPAPPCVRDGILQIRTEIFTGSAKTGSQDERVAGAKAPQSGKCATVFLFTPSPDGRTLTLTKPAENPALKSVFDKQE